MFFFFFFATCLRMTGPVSVRNKTALQLRRDVVMRPVSSCTSGRPGAFTTSLCDWMSPAAKTIQTLSASFSPGGRLSPDLFCSQCETPSAGSNMFTPPPHFQCLRPDTVCERAVTGHWWRSSNQALRRRIGTWSEESLQAGVNMRGL